MRRTSWPRPLQSQRWAGAQLAQQSLYRVHGALSAALAQQVDAGEDPLPDASDDRRGDDASRLACGDAVLLLADVAHLDVGQVEGDPLPPERGIGHRHPRAANREALDDELALGASYHSRVSFGRAFP